MGREKAFAEKEKQSKKKKRPDAKAKECTQNNSI